MSSATLQDVYSMRFFNAAETETLALFEHLHFGFLEEFDVVAPAQTGQTREHKPPEMMRGFLYVTTTISTAFVRSNRSFGIRLSG